MSENALRTEIENLAEHSHRITRELTELRKERAAWKETARHAQELEEVVASLHSELQAAQLESVRLRRQNEEYEKKLELEIADNADTRMRWQEKERLLLNQLKSERAKVKEFKSIKRENEQGFDRDDDDTIAPSSSSPSPHPPQTTPPPSNASSRGLDATALQEDNISLTAQILTLTAILQKRELEIAKQNEDILELQKTVAALMDDIENGFEQAQFEMYGEVPERAPSPVSIAPVPSAAKPQNTPPGTPAHGATLTPPSTELSRRKRSGTFAREAANATSMQTAVAPSPSSALNTVPTTKSFNSLADELRSIGEKVSADGGGSTLRSRMAALGLSTEGNREVLRRRLHKYIARKKRQAQAQAARGANVE
ncbi:hypothetical protein DFJ73DRAFT_841422 [Zopfochytrium polystomum]|nr:hypothetical protein DFJ73DRAFT_841422 [Zopfochytrium polystomum]